MKQDFHKITFWGTRGSFPTPRKDTVEYGGHTSCVEIRTSKNQLIILDMGTGLLDLGNYIMKEKSPPASAHVFVSHYHWDHIFGFLGFTPLFNPNFTFNMYGKKDLMTPKEIIDYVQNPTFWPINMEMLNAKIHLNEVSEKEIFIDDNIKVTFTLHGHPNGANTYRFNIDGVIIVYATDCEHPSDGLNQNVIEQSKNADILIHDAQYTTQELPNHKGWGHSSWQQAIEVAKIANVKQLVLYHHDPARDDDSLSKIEKEAQKVFSNTCAAKQGQTICLPT